MKPFLSIFGERSPESPLEGLPVLFPHGTPSRDVTISREDAPTVKRSMTLAQFVASFNEIAVGAGIISRTEAWKNPHVRRCVEANAQAIASLPFAIYSGQEPQKKHWWLDFVQHPNEFLQMSEHDLKEQTVAVRELFGECFWFLDREDAPTRGGKKAPIAHIWIYHPHAVTEAIDSRSRRQIGWFFQFETERFFVDLADCVQFRRYDAMRHNPLRPTRGTSPLDAAMLAVSTDVSASKFNLDFFSRGIAPGIILTSKEQLEPGSEDKLKDKLRAQHVGKNAAPLILDGGEIEVHSTSTTQKDSEFIAGARKSMNEIAEVFGVPPCILGNQDQKYDNAEMQLLLWWDGPLSNIRSNLRAAINNGPLKAEATITCDFDTKDVEVLQKRKRARIDQYINLITNARHSPKVAAQMVGLDVDPSMPGYDKVLVGYNQIPYELMEEGASVMVKDEPSDEPTADAAESKPKAAQDDALDETEDEAAKVIAEEPKEDEPRMIRVVTSLSEGPTIRVTPHVSYRAAESDETLRLILQIITGDDEKLRKLAKRFQFQAIETGSKQVGKLLGIDALIAIDNPRVVEFLEQRGNLIVSVNATTAEKINRVVRELMDEGSTPELIGEEIRDAFRLRESQAKLIARQEVGSGLNGGRFLQMEEEGADRHEWLSSRDDRVRESHERLDGETVTIGEQFSNGCRYPQDPDGDTAEVIGCRCITLPATSSRSRITGEARADYWRAVVKNVRSIERVMTSQLERYFFNQRSAVLKALSERGLAK
jgi:SPP1 gp7 family putative phage head morphogenesis protein